MPPSVVQTRPAAGTTDVDPSLTELRVQFSKDMADGRWSWVQVSSDSFPTTNGDPHYAADERTCTLPVTLKPDTTYVVWINSDRYTNFRDAQGLVAVPYQLVFQTRP
jgi:RNA polymerase sigma-70 factor (ECF subfamily)